MSQESRHMSHHFARNPWKQKYEEIAQNAPACALRQAWAFQLGHIGMNLVLVARQL